MSKIMTIMEFPKLQQDFFKGRGAQINPFNPFNDKNYTQEHIEGLDEEMITTPETQYFTENAKNVINKVESEDVGMMYSVNPYQGCEHGCVYCYARNSHNYWGFSAGLDFETRIIIKHNAPALLEKVFLDPKWIAAPISFSGNTDCYQPIERKMQITRKLLEVGLKYKNPMGIITKNQLVVRDLDILQQLAEDNLAQVYFSITSLKEDIRSKMEPRTATYKTRLKAIEKLSLAGIPVGIMIGPVIPGLTDSEIPEILKAAAEHGATSAGYNMVRLNGAIDKIFTDWIWKSFPMHAERVLNNIKAVHAGKLNDSRWSKRMSGDGELADVIKKMFHLMRDKYMGSNPKFKYNLDAFRRPGQLKLEF